MELVGEEKPVDEVRGECSAQSAAAPAEDEVVVDEAMDEGRRDRERSSACWMCEAAVA